MPPLAILLLFVPGFLPAYGPEAHRVIATIAEDNLTTPVRDEIHQMLGGQTMASVSSWADRYRRDHGETSSWHYIDREITTGEILKGSDVGGTILDAISSQSAVLASQGPIEERRKALMFLIHFLGDLHQPNHTADNYDHGGNEVMTTGTGRQLKLHAVWDVAIVERMLREKRTTPEAYARRLQEANASRKDLLTSGTADDWAMESFETGKRVVYSYARPAEPGGFVTLDDAYMERAESALEHLMCAAGYRLAATLNALLENRAKSVAPTETTTRSL